MNLSIHETNANSDATSSQSTLKEKTNASSSAEVTSLGAVKETEATAPSVRNANPEDAPSSTAPGLFYHGGLEEAIEKCKKQVERIAKDCRAKNRKFRDLEFDLENDTDICLQGTAKKVKEPTGFQRVTEIFDEPHFFNPEGAASSNDIKQGALGDCWFLSALATISSLPRLIERICVARDEKVGVYGFVFHKDSGWVGVIIDDILCTNIPHFEQLNTAEQSLYHDDRIRYNTVARKGGKALTFAKSGSHGETWVPLIEKAYAKFYGSYSNLEGGFTREALEDLTGGVSTLIHSKDIFDHDSFWKDELLKAHQDRLFACGFDQLSKARHGEDIPRVQGLFGSHAYSVLRAVECKGKRFVVLRNPWGQSEWTGRWADGSREWTEEWLKILPELGHVFGDDGQFVMEYDDFIQHFTQIDRTILLDSDWNLASYWVTAPVDPSYTPWTYGKVSFVVSVLEKTNAIIALSQVNRRFFKSDQSCSAFAMSFVIVKQGDTEPLDESLHTRKFHKTVNVELELDAGTYFVYVKLEHVQMMHAPEDDDDDESEDDDKEGDDAKKKKTKQEFVDTRVIAKTASDKVLELSHSSNYVAGEASKFIPVTLDQVIQRDIAYMAKNKGRPKGCPKTTFLRRLFGKDGPRNPAPQVQMKADLTEPDDGFAGLLDHTATMLNLGLKVYTRSKAPATIIGRIKGEF